MKTLKTICFAAVIILVLASLSTHAQQKVWSLNDCILYALEINIDIQKAGLSQDRNQLNAIQAENNRLPSVSASLRQNFNWSRSYNASTGDYDKLTGSNNTSIGLNSGISLFNGFSHHWQIFQLCFMI